MVFEVSYPFTERMPVIEGRGGFFPLYCYRHSIPNPKDRSTMQDYRYEPCDTFRLHLDERLVTMTFMVIRPRCKPILMYVVYDVTAPLESAVTLASGRVPSRRIRNPKRIEAAIRLDLAIHHKDLVHVSQWLCIDR